MRITFLALARTKQITRTVFAALSLLTFFAAPSSASSILPSAWDVITTTGVVGVLRAGSPWGPGSALAAQSSIVDDAFVPEQQQWNTGSWWWDEDPSVNASPVVTTIHLNQLYTIDSFTVQADNNDTYRLEYWDGAAFQLAWDVPAIAGFGLMTRTSGPLPSFSTDLLRFTATGGDNYYSVSEIQADGFATADAVPEPATILLLGSGLVGVARRYRKRS
jgi:hypothetical protein